SRDPMGGLKWSEARSRPMPVLSALAGLDNLRAAWRQVRSRQSASGVDGETLVTFAIGAESRCCADCTTSCWTRPNGLCLCTECFYLSGTAAGRPSACQQYAIASRSAPLSTSCYARYAYAACGQVRLWLHA